MTTIDKIQKNFMITVVAMFIGIITGNIFFGIFCAILIFFMPDAIIELKKKYMVR